MNLDLPACPVETTLLLIGDKLSLIHIYNTGRIERCALRQSVQRLPVIIHMGNRRTVRIDAHNGQMRVVLPRLSLRQRRLVLQNPCVAVPADGCKNYRANDHKQRRYQIYEPAFQWVTP